MELLEFREDYVTQIAAAALEEESYKYEVFIDKVSEIMVSDWSMLSGIEQCHCVRKEGNRSFKSHLIHAGSLELSTNTLNLLISDDNFGELTNINERDIKSASEKMLSYFENVLKGYFVNGEQADTAVQLAIEIRRHYSEIYKIHLFYVSANQLNSRIKNIDLDDTTIQDKTYKVELDVVDIVKIFNAHLASSEKEDTIINVTDFGVDGIPCIRADIGIGRYEAYLAVVPGEFLANIYKKYGPRLLEGNVRSFLQFRGGVNKGIRGTILNERENFFSYNNGISTTAKNVVIEEMPGKGMYITSFTDLQIINGGQTTASLASASIKEGAPLNGIFVQMKLTVIIEEDEEFIRHVSQFANSQNKVTAADLNSNHPFYQRIEDFSRKIYAPAANGSPLQTIWFFERSRGQYEQPKMKMSKGERGTYERINSSSQRFDKTDLAKFINSADSKPYDVAWGREVNAVRFQVEMEKQWKNDPSVFNESYYRDLIAKAIIFINTRKTILTLDWYKENKGYLVQLVTYTFAKLSYEVQRFGKVMNYRYIWDKQGLPDFLVDEIAEIAYKAREVFFSPDRTNGNIETFCKQKECWARLQALHYELSEKTKAFLIDHEDVHEEKVIAKKDQRFSDSINNEVEIFEKGAEYWRRMKASGLEQGVINGGDAQTLDLAIAYCQGIRSLPQSVFKKITAIREKLHEAQIPV